MTGETKESGSGKSIRTLTTEQTIVFEAVNFMFLFAISAENTINVAWYSVCCIQSVISCVLYVPVQFPSQIGSVLRSQAYQHMMSYTKDKKAAARFEYWISNTLQEGERHEVR